MGVSAILRYKGHDVASVEPACRVEEVARKLSALGIGAVIVRETDGEPLLGILSERDIVHAIAEHGTAALGMEARALMTHNVRTISSQVTVAEAMSMMTAGKFRHLPVVDDGELVGIVSIGDAVKARLLEQESEVDNLRAYVASS